MKLHLTKKVRKNLGSLLLLILVANSFDGLAQDSAENTNSADTASVKMVCVTCLIGKTAYDPDVLKFVDSYTDHFGKKNHGFKIEFIYVSKDFESKIQSVFIRFESKNSFDKYGKWLQDAYQLQSHYKSTQKAYRNDHFEEKTSTSNDLIAVDLSSSNMPPITVYWTKGNKKTQWLKYITFGTADEVVRNSGDCVFHQPVSWQDPEFNPLKTKSYYRLLGSVINKEQSNDLVKNYHWTLKNQVLQNVDSSCLFTIEPITKENNEDGLYQISKFTYFNPSRSEYDILAMTVYDDWLSFSSRYESCGHNDSFNLSILCGTKDSLYDSRFMMNNYNTNGSFFYTNKIELIPVDLANFKLTESKEFYDWLPKIGCIANGCHTSGIVRYPDGCTYQGTFSKTGLQNGKILDVNGHLVQEFHRYIPEAKVEIEKPKPVVNKPFPQATPKTKPNTDRDDLMLYYKFMLKELDTLGGTYMRYFNEITDGYQDDDQFMKKLYFDNARNAMKAIYKNLKNIEYCAQQIRQYNKLSNYCPDINSELDLIEQMTVKTKLLVNEIYKVSWSFYTVQDYVRDNKPKGNKYFTYTTYLYNHAYIVAALMDSCDSTSK